MLTDVPCESEEEVKKRVTVYEARFINRYTEKDDGYRNCIQKAARHNQVPVIDFDKSQCRKKVWTDRRPYHNRSRYHNNNQGPSFRKQDDYSYRRQEEAQSDYQYLNRNMSYQPSATPSAPPSATLIVDFPSEDQPFQEEFPADPQTPGGHDFQNAPIPYEEKNRMPRINKDVHLHGMDQDYDFPEQQWPNVHANMAPSIEPDQEVTVPPKPIPIIEDFLPTHQKRVTDEDCKTILSNASIPAVERPIDKGSKQSKALHTGVHKPGGGKRKAEKTAPLPQVMVPGSRVPVAQVLNLLPMPSHSNPPGHHTRHLHQPSPPGMHVTHGALRNVSEFFIASQGREIVDTGTSKKKKKKDKKKDKDKYREEKKGKKKVIHNTVEKSDVTGEESNGSIDVTTVELASAEVKPSQRPNFNSTVSFPRMLQCSNDVPDMRKRKKHRKDTPYD